MLLVIFKEFTGTHKADYSVVCDILQVELQHIETRVVLWFSEVPLLSTTEIFWLSPFLTFALGMLQIFGPIFKIVYHNYQFPPPHTKQYYLLI